MFPTQDFFRIALIAHGDQSVLIWFLAFAGLLWSLGGRGPLPLARTAFALAAAGCVLVTLAPFLGAAFPLLNNDVPVLVHPLFLVALGVFALGVLLQVVLYLATALPRARWGDPIGVGVATSAAAALLAAVSLVWTWGGLSPSLRSRRRAW
jgi:uncharacterized membrane protein YidH (DUF202 family)